MIAGVTAVRCEIANSIAMITLDGPDRRNAMAKDSWQQLPEIIRLADEDASCRVIVMRGGSGHFGAGADITEFEEVFATRAAATSYFATMDQAMRAVEGASKPVIAAIEGCCFGASVALALACDIRLAAADSRYAITPAKLGITYPFGDVKRVLTTIGAGRTKMLMFNGQVISAQTALVIGLIDQIADGQFNESVSSFAQSIADCSLWTNLETKRAITHLLAGADAESAGYPDVLVNTVEGPDFAEGMAAFLQRRRPIFKYSG